MRYAFVLALTLFSVGCGGDGPAGAPTPVTTNIAGNWSGTFTYTPISGGQRVVVATTATFTQAAEAVNGQVNIGGGGSMTVSGTVTNGTALTISVLFSAPGNPCTGSATVSGSVANSQVRFTVPSLAASGGCLFFTNGEFALTR